MKYEVIKQAFKLGNSSGVLLPRGWEGKKVSVKLIDKSIQQEVIEILDGEDLLKNTIAIFLAGSYARGEETEASDIDMLIITDTVDKKIKRGKYELTLVSKGRFESLITKSLYLASLVNEAKAILNPDFLGRYKNMTWKISLKEHLSELESIIRINEQLIVIDEELNEKVGDETLYSLVLRFRELYLISCLRKKKAPSNKEFISILKEVASEECYNAYLRVKNNLRTKAVISVSEARALMEEIKKRVRNLKDGKKN